MDVYDVFCQVVSGVILSVFHTKVLLHVFIQESHSLCVFELSYKCVQYIKYKQNILFDY